MLTEPTSLPPIAVNNEKCPNKHRKSCPTNNTSPISSLKGSTNGAVPLPFTMAQLARIDEFREALGEKLLQQTPIFNDPYSLMRWLNAWGPPLHEPMEEPHGGAGAVAATLVNASTTSNNNNNHNKKDHHHHLFAEVVRRFSHASRILCAMHLAGRDHSSIFSHLRHRHFTEKKGEEEEEVILNIDANGVGEEVDLDELNANLARVTRASPHYPGGVMGYDSEGNVVALQCLGACRPKSLAHCGRISDVYRLCLTETAAIYQLVRGQEARRGRKLGLKVIVDLAGFCTEHLFTSTLRTYANVMRMLQALFPDLAQRVYVINAPMMVAVAWAVVKAVLSEQSREKVVFLGADYASYLCDELGAENVLAAWGGSLTPRVGNPLTGMLRMGGVPPPHMRYNKALNPLHVHDSNLLTRLYVPARHKRVVEVEVEHNNSTFHWFLTTNGDVEFAIAKLSTTRVGTYIEELHNEEKSADQHSKRKLSILDASHPSLKSPHHRDWTGEHSEVDEWAWPPFIVNSEFVPEYGSLTGLQEGTYALVFDNSQAAFFGREARYRVWVESPSEM